MEKDRSRMLVIDASNKCSLQCPKCGRQAFVSQKKRIPGRKLTVDQFKKLIDYFNEGIEFTGQYSDATMNPHLPEFLTLLNDRDIPSRVCTAASYRSKDWYIDCFRRSPKTEWVFGVDGLPEESHQYRVGQNGEKLFDIMCTAASMGIRVVWQYIVFRYNELSIQEAMLLAEENNIIFELNLSSRWDHNDPLKPVSKKYVKIPDFS